MSNPSIPVGPGAGSQSPPQAQQSPSAASHMQASEPAPNPAAVKTLGADVSKSFDASGQIFAEGLTAQRVTSETPGQPGDTSNVEVTPASFPRNGKSRAPQASAPGPRTVNLNKIRRK